MKHLLSTTTISNLHSGAFLDLSQTPRSQATEGRQLKSKAGAINVGWAVSAKKCGGENEKGCKGLQHSQEHPGRLILRTARQKELTWEIRLLSQLFLGLVVGGEHCMQVRKGQPLLPWQPNETHHCGFFFFCCSCSSYCYGPLSCLYSFSVSHFLGTYSYLMLPRMAVPNND